MCGQGAVRRDLSGAQMRTFFSPMHQILPAKGNVHWVRVSGKLTREDYADLVPRWERMLEGHGRIRLLFEMAPDFEGWEPGAAWDDAKFSVSNRERLERVAMVGDKKWEQWAAKAGALLVKAEVRFFDSSNLESAVLWLKE